jgi:hypothetical protein
MERKKEGRSHQGRKGGKKKGRGHSISQ